MNTRFTFAFIRHLHSRRQSGFALAMALCVGLVVLVVGATMMIRAQGDQSKVVSQTFSKQAEAIAEAGAAQYVNFLNSNRGLIPYPSCVAQDSTTGACNDSTSSTTVKSWTTAGATSGNLAGIGTGTSPVAVGGTTSCTSSAGGGGIPPANYQTVSSNSGSPTIVSWANSSNSNGWRSSGNGGTFRLISYQPTYTTSGDVTTVNSAQLIVEGKSGTGTNAGVARMAFTIPVAPSTVTASGGSGGGGFPGLWAKDFNYGNNTTAYSNVWDSSGCGSGTDGFSSTIDKIPLADASNRPTLASGVDATPGANNGNKEIYTKSGTTGVKTMVNQAFPALPNSTDTTPSWPAATFSTTSANVNSCNWSSTSQYPNINDKDSTGKVYGNTTPTTADDPAADATYVYDCGDLDGKGSNLTLGRTGRETLVFHVNGYLKFNANGNLVPYYNSGTNQFTRSIFYVKNAVEVNANGSIGDMRDPSAFQIYDYQVDAGTYGETGYQHSLEMKGNGSLYAFLFAPFANMESGGTTDVAGALWIKSTQANGNPKVWQGIFGTSRLMVTLPNSGSVTTYNLGGQPSQWKRCSTASATSCN